MLDITADDYFWTLDDYQGSIREARNADGTEGFTREYDTFGNLTDETQFDANNPVDVIFGYTGREFDEETRLQYNRARYYDPSNGRFISNDPIGFAGGDTNLYRYVGNSPTIFVDPSGLSPVPQNGATSGQLGSGGQGSGISRSPVPLGPPLPPAATPPGRSSSPSQSGSSLLDLTTVPYMDALLGRNILPAPDNITGPIASDQLIFMGGPAGTPPPVRAAAELAASTIPWVGEIQDAQVIGDPNSTWGERAAATVSLGANFATFGFLPNAGSVIRAKRAVHKNSLDYVGETHVYRIIGPNGTYKIGESAQGVRVRDGASIRGEQQVRALRRQTGEFYQSEVLKTFPGKRMAREYETQVIERFERMFGNGALPGNKTNR